MGNSSNPPSDPESPSFGSPRTVPRFTFVAVAEITENKTQACVMGKIAEISRKGCYVDILNTFPVDTSLNIVISRDGKTFASEGKVIYTHHGFGMGVVFLTQAADQLKILDTWLAERPAGDSL